MIKNNKGYTLIELIIAVAIMSLLATAIALSFNIVFATGTTEAANDFNTLVSYCKVAALSGEEEPYVALLYDTTEEAFFGEVYFGTYQAKRERLSDQRILVSYTPQGGSATDIDASNSIITFGFNSDGAFDFTAGTNPIITGEIDSISFTAGGTTKTLDFTATTGYIELN